MAYLVKKYEPKNGSSDQGNHWMNRHGSGEFVDVQLDPRSLTSMRGIVAPKHATLRNTAFSRCHFAQTLAPRRPGMIGKDDTI